MSVTSLLVQVVCLQEVEEEHYHDWFSPKLSGLGSLLIHTLLLHSLTYASTHPSLQATQVSTRRELVITLMAVLCSITHLV